MPNVSPNGGPAEAAPQPPADSSAPAAPPREQWVNSARAAALLGVSTQTLAHWRLRGRGPDFARLSKTAVRYRLDVLERFMRERSRDSAA